MNQQQEQGDHHGTRPGLCRDQLRSLSFWSLHFGWGGRKRAAAFKLERIGNIPRLCRIRDNYRSVLNRQKVVPNITGLGLGEGCLEVNSGEGWYSRCQLSLAPSGALN